MHASSRSSRSTGLHVEGKTDKGPNLNRYVVGLVVSPLQSLGLH